MLKVLYPDFVFPDGLSAETYLTMTMDTVTTETITDMMKTRQYYMGVEDNIVDQNDFLALRALLQGQKKSYGSNVVAPNIASNNTWNQQNGVYNGPQQQILQPYPPIDQAITGEGIHVAPEQVANVLSGNKLYDLRQQTDGTMRAYPLGEAQTFYSMKSKHDFLKAVIDQLNLVKFDTPRDDDQVREYIKDAISLKTLSRDSSKYVGIQEILKTCRDTKQGNEKSKIFAYWACTIGRLSKDKPNKCAWDAFRGLVECSNPLSQAEVVCCFLDVLNVYITTKNIDKREIYKAYDDEGAIECSYLPSDVAVANHTKAPEQRWTSLFKDLFSKHFDP